MRQKRILYIYSSIQASGASMQLRRMASGLDPKKFQPIIACGDPDLFNDLEPSGVKVIKIQFPSFFYDEKGAQIEARYRIGVGNLYALKRLIRILLTLPWHRRSLAKLCREQQPDIIHVNGMTLVFTGFLAHTLGLPVVYHARGEPADNVWGKLSVFLAKKFADRILAVSEHVAKSFGTENVEIIHMPLSLTTFHPELSGDKIRQEQNIPKNAPCVGFVGRMTAAKGIFDFVDSAPAILAKTPAAHFLVIGNASKNLERILNKKIVQLGLKDRFHLAGWHSNVLACMAGMDVVTFPSWTEGTPNAVLEAMSMAKPVVATDIPALREIMISGRHGLLVPPGKPQELASACLKFIQDQDFAQSCSIAARQWMVEKYSHPKQIERLEAIYDEIAPM